MNETHLFELEIETHLAECNNGYSAYVGFYNGWKKLVYSQRDLQYGEKILITKRELLSDKPIFRKD